MGDYRRSTHECHFEQLLPEMVAVIRDQAQRHERYANTPQAKLAPDTGLETLA